MAHADAWLKFHGPRRIAAEYRDMHDHFQKGKIPFIKDMTVAGDSMTTWRLKLCNFDNDIAGGYQLNKDIEFMKTQYVLATQQWIWRLASCVSLLAASLLFRLSVAQPGVDASAPTCDMHAQIQPGPHSP
jgi:hypothetical protein